MNKKVISKEINYKGYTKIFTIEIEQLHTFDEKAMDKIKYKETEESLNLIAQQKFDNQKFEWIFTIEQNLQK